MAQSARSGFVVISVMVVIVISLALFGVWARAAVRENRRVGDHQLRLKATRLAESGLRRGLAQRNARSDYTGEIWSIPADEMGAHLPAEVRIKIASDATNEKLMIEAEAEYPKDTTRQARITKKAQIPWDERGMP
jgi:hypothetical protein